MSVETGRFTAWWVASMLSEGQTEQMKKPQLKECVKTSMMSLDTSTQVCGT